MVRLVNVVGKAKAFDIALLVRLLDEKQAEGIIWFNNDP